MQNQLFILGVLIPSKAGQPICIIINDICIAQDRSATNALY